MRDSSCGKNTKRVNAKPRCVLIAGPNGAGKTTFAREYLPHDVRILNFLNADLIAAGLSPLKPELAARPAARLMLEEIDRLTDLHVDFAWESTLSGVTYAKRIRILKETGYHVEIIYLQLATPQIAIRRIASRVRQGGHNVPTADLLRRFSRSWSNFQNTYRSLADACAVYDNSSWPPTLATTVTLKPETGLQRSDRDPGLAARVRRALIRAGESARRTARMHGTSLHVWEDGKVVAKRP